MAATVGPWGEVRKDGRLAVSLLLLGVVSNRRRSIVQYPSTHQCEKISSTAGNKAVKSCVAVFVSLAVLGFGRRRYVQRRDTTTYCELAITSAILDLFILF
eukprot:scaffold55810_cov49-Cyclotella_meneghiniana.AAC.7